MCSFLHSCSGVFSIFRGKCLNFALQNTDSKLQKVHFVTSRSFQEGAVWVGTPPHSDRSPPSWFSQVNFDHCHITSF